MRHQLRVLVLAVARLGISVHKRRGQLRQRVQQIVLGADRHEMRLDRGGIGIDDHLAFGPQPMADPAEPDLTDVQHARRAAQHLPAWSTSDGSTASISRQ